METIPENIVDQGYINVSTFTLSSITYLNEGMEIRFDSRKENNKGFFIKMEHVVAFRSNIDTSSFFWIRVDGGDTSFAHEISIRLKEERIKAFKLLYIFKEEDHSAFVFRCLAENISIVHYDNTQ
jgi:hypothetical protein